MLIWVGISFFLGSQHFDNGIIHNLVRANNTCLIVFSIYSYYKKQSNYISRSLLAVIIVETILNESLEFALAFSRFETENFYWTKYLLSATICIIYFVNNTKLFEDSDKLLKDSDFMQGKCYIVCKNPNKLKNLFLTIISGFRSFGLVINGVLYYYDKKLKKHKYFPSKSKFKIVREIKSNIDNKDFEGKELNKEWGIRNNCYVLLFKWAK